MKRISGFNNAAIVAVKQNNCRIHFGAMNKKKLWLEWKTLN